MTTTPQVKNGGIKLQNAWTIYYDVREQRSQQAEKYNQSLTKLGTFDTVQDFWRYWNNIDISKLPPYSNLRLFKNNIAPCWEDEMNARGGKWVVLKQKGENVMKDWLLLVLNLIGEQFVEGDDMCGTVLSMRPQFCTISVWNKSSQNREIVNRTEREICQCLQITKDKIRYQLHQESMEMNKLTFKTKKQVGRDSLTKSTPTSPNTSRLNQDNGNEDDFRTPYLDLERESKERTPSPNKDDRINEESPSDYILENIYHRRSQSVEHSKPRTINTHPLASSIDSGLRGFHIPETPQTYPLPKKHRRKGRRTSVGDISAVFQTTPISNKLQTSNSSLGINTSQSKSRLPCITTIPEHSVPMLHLAKEKPTKKRFLGILHSYWFAFIAMMFILFVTSHYITVLVEPQVAKSL